MERGFFGGGSNSHAETLPQRICGFLKNEKMSINDKKQLTTCFKEYYKKNKKRVMIFADYMNPAEEVHPELFITSLTTKRNIKQDY